MTKPGADPHLALPASGVLDKAMWHATLEVDDQQRYRLCAALRDPAPKLHGKVAVWVVAYTDAAGRLLDGPYPGLLYSRQLAQHFTYVAADGQISGAAPHTFMLQPPKDAAHVALALLPWMGSSKLALVSPPRLVPCAYGPKELAELEETDPMAAVRECRLALLAMARPDWQLLNYALRLAERQGDAVWMRECAASLTEMGKPGGAVARGRLGLSRLDELSVGWSPLPASEALATAPAPLGSVEQSGSRKMRTQAVLHWAGPEAPLAEPPVSLGEALSDRRWRNVLIVPLEYAACDAPMGPWRHGRISVPTASGARKLACYRLDCLSEQGVATTARTAVMTLDVLLAWHIAKTEGAAVIHAHPGRRGYDLALRALALGRLLALPVIYEYDSHRLGMGEGESRLLPQDCEIQRLRQAQNVRCLHESAAVIVRRKKDLDEATRAGVDIAKLFFLDAAARTENLAAQRSLGDIYQSVAASWQAGLLTA
ncbi:hypothetical protein ANDA3_3903 [plant metagenome]|uniref:Uncharacterized protein n=1 Tax=plant metagenome TaxID=1297885 RepID=A0A484QA38_9ZZZZ